MQNSDLETENVSGVIDAPRNWLPFSLVLFNIIPHGSALMNILFVDMARYSVEGVTTGHIGSSACWTLSRWPRCWFRWRARQGGASGRRAGRACWFCSF
ncbi:MAG: hypothetical protein IKO07_06715 [Clostridia bacterium]|nr:hypothetical protein [Clostridia bacterium]